MIKFSKYLIDWFDRNKRDLPWRDTSMPYNIWISEIILQQTRVDQGANYFLRFIEAFPNVKSLAKANQQEVLKLWQGLGYYSRARNLHKAAHYVMDELNGIFPSTYNNLLKLPGVGPYTAAAIASIAFNEVVAAIDGNGKRVFTRVYNISDPIDDAKTIKTITQHADTLIDDDRPGDFNQAVMELGATICLPKKPNCNICPVNKFCKAYEIGNQSELPVKRRKVKVRKRYFNYFVFIYNGKTTLIERKGNDIWKGLNEFPLIETKGEIEGDVLIKQAIDKWGINEFDIIDVKFLAPIKHILTHQHIFAVFCVMNLSAKPTKLKMETCVNEIRNIPVSRLTDIFLSMEEKFL